MILHYNIIGPPSYMRSVFDRNVVMRRMTVLCFREFVWCAFTNVKESKWHSFLCPYLSVQKLTVYQQSCTDGLHRLCDHL